MFCLQRPQGDVRGMIDRVDRNVQRLLHMLEGIKRLNEMLAGVAKEEFLIAGT